MRTCLTVFLLLVLTATAYTKNISLLGYTAGGKFPPATPSTNDNPLDVRAQLQAAIDEVADSGGGTVSISGDTLFWFLSRPVFLDRANVILQGEGGDVTRLGIINERNNGDVSSIPPLLVGVPRAVIGKEITATHREALAFDANRPQQTLDASAGERFGLRTKGRSADNLHECLRPWLFQQFPARYWPVGTPLPGRFQCLGLPA